MRCWEAIFHIYFAEQSLCRRYFLHPCVVTSLFHFDENAWLFFRKITTDGIKTAEAAPAVTILRRFKSATKSSHRLSFNSQGDKIILDNALVSTWPVDLLIVSHYFAAAICIPVVALPTGFFFIPSLSYAFQFFLSTVLL